MPAAKETVVHIQASKLKPNPWQSEVGPPLSDEDYAMLMASVEQDGIQIPLIVWKCGAKLIVLSGSNRLRVAKELGLATVPVIVREFANKHAARMFALTDNLARRQLTTGQRAYLAYQFQQLLTVGKGHRTDLQPSSQMTKVDARKTAAKRAGVSEGSVSAIKNIIENDDGELLQCIVRGKLSVSEARELARSSVSIRRKVLDVLNNGGAKRKVSRLIREADIAARKASARRYANENGLATNHDILHGDLKLLGKRLKDSSVKMFLTDPPYAEVDLYARLAELAATKLVPGGLCLAYADPGRLPEVLDAMREHLDWWWCFVVSHTGKPRYINDRHLQSQWKPIVAFGRGDVPLPPEWLGDFLEGGGRDKEHHRWGQPESEARYLVTRLTEAGDLVVDPFCGGGTVPAACKALGRRWLATEIDKETVAIARKRLADMLKVNGRAKS